MVYFIQQGSTGPIKIGKSESVLARLTELQVSNPTELKLLGILTKASDTEKNLHTKFRLEHLRGEWFAPSKRLLKYIEVSTSPVELAKKLGEGLSPLGDPITWRTESCTYVRFDN